MTTISVQLTSDNDPETDAIVTLTYGLRTAVGNVTVLPAGTELPHVGGGVYALDVSNVVTPGTAYETNVKVEHSDGSIDYDDRPFTVPGDSPEGTYASWQGIQDKLGRVNAITYSNLDPNESNSDIPEPDFDRVNSVIATADAYTDYRAVQGNHKYTLPISPSVGAFKLIQEAANLYASYILAEHRIIFGGDVSDEEAKMILGKRKRALELYDMLFGPARDGIEGATVDPEGTPQPGTFVNVKMRFEPTCTSDEFSA